MMKSPRAWLLALSLTLLAAAHTLLGAGLWLGMNDDAFAVLQPLNCLIPLFCQLNFQRYFGIAFICIIVALIAFVVAERGKFGFQVISELGAPPGALHFQSRRWRVVFLAMLLLSVSLSLVFAYVTITPPGKPPPALWAATLALVAGTFYCADRASGRRALLSREEQLLLIAYVAFLLTLGLALREPLLRAAAVVVALTLGVRTWRTHARLREPIAFALIVMSAFAVYTIDLTSWRYAFIGDEYAFFEYANNIINGIAQPYILSPMGAYDVHPVFATFVQIATMMLYGNDIYGWRVSETLAVMLAALPLYVAVRAFVNVRAALVALIVFLASQHLLGLTKVGYTYAQLLVPLLASVALCVLAARRGNLLGFFLSGAAAAFAFYTFALGIPFIVLPVLMFGLCSLAPHSGSSAARSLSPAWRLMPGRFSRRFQALLPAAAALMLGIGLTAMPSLSDPQALERIAGHTVANSEVSAANNLTQQVIPNFLYTLGASLSFLGHSHYVNGAHLDPLSSILMLLGAAAAVAALRTSRMALWLLVGFVLACLITGGFAPYPYPPIARTYILIPFYALFAAFGASHVFASLEVSRLARLGIPAWIVLMVSIPALNLYQFFVLTDQHNPQEQVAMVVKEFQTQSAESTVYLVEGAPFNFSVTRMVLRAYHLNADRLRAVTDVSLVGELPGMLRSGENAILVSWDSPARDQWRSSFRQLWPGQSDTIISDATGLNHYVRLAVSGDNGDAGARATATSGPLPATPFVVSAGAQPQVLASWKVERPRDVAVAPDASVYVINGARQTIEVHAPDGKLLSILPGDWQAPSALAFNSRGELLVLDSGTPSVSRLRMDGTVISRSDPESKLRSPRGIAVDANDDVYVADTGNSRIVHFNAELLSPQTFPSSIPLQQPTSLTFAGSKLIAADGPWLYVLSPTGELNAQWSITPYSTVQPPRMLAYQSESIVMTDPEAGEIVVYDLQGHVVQRIGPPAYDRMRKPLGLAAATDGRVFVAEYDGNVIHVFGWAAP
jgi:DNA-binding beta-propeller fold protein YncE